MTECPQIACNPLAAPRAGSVGPAVVEDLAIVDGAGRTLPPGAWGEVALRGAPLMAGYLDRATGGAASRDGWFHTGDEGRLDDDGYLYVRGRIAERINRGGVMVAPADVDTALLTHGDVRQAAAFPVPHASLGEDLAAAVVMKPGSTTDAAALRRHVAAQWEPSHVPSAIVIADTLPIGGSGKVVRRDLARVLTARLHPECEPPCGADEVEMRDLFASVLASRALLLDTTLGRHSNFFLEGGDSLAAMQVIASLARCGRGEHPPTLIFENPTPALLARALEMSPDTTGGHLVPLQAEGDRSPVVFVHGISGVLPLGFAAMATALGSGRPILALHNAGFVPEAVTRTSVPELADRYAQQIIGLGREGPVHLVGYSAAGWYAHAVADALLQRGAPVGMLAILDSAGPIALPRNARLMVKASGARRLLGELRRPPAGQRRGEVARRIAERTRQALGSQAPTGAVVPQTLPWAWDDPFRLMLDRGYRPPKVPLTADVFATRRNMAHVRRLWRPYVAAIRYHRLFEEHLDYQRPENTPELVARLQDILAGFD
jgi:thioesterase domain-containing protein